MKPVGSQVNFSLGSCIAAVANHCLLEGIMKKLHVAVCLPPSVAVIEEIVDLPEIVGE